MPQDHARWEVFEGLRIIGDVHGEADAFRAAVEDASARRLYVVQLGDLIDRGPDSVAAVRLALDLIDRGTGLFLRANHDDKLRRHLLGNPVKVGAELARTLKALAAANDHADLLARLRAALDAAPWWLRVGNYLLVHGAFHPAMLTAASPELMPSQADARRCRRLAIYGDASEAENEDDPPIRSYDWIDQIPAGITVVIGHDVIATDRVVERHGALGGRTLFCDTGAGKGGKLSWIDLPKSAIKSAISAAASSDPTRDDDRNRDCRSGS
jgi:hypothetical protein